MTTGRINQVARDEPPPEPHAHNPEARAPARTRTRSARSNDGTPGIRHLRPTDKPHAQPDAKPHPTRRIARPHDAPNSRRRCAKDTHATHDGAPGTPKPHDHAATPPRTSSRPRKDTPPRLPHTRHALRQRPNGTHAGHAGGASSDHSNEARAQCSPAEAQLTPSARYQARRQAAHATERTAQRPRPQAAKTGRVHAPSPTRALAPHV